jgi:hypothetical protein
MVAQLSGAARTAAVAAALLFVPASPAAADPPSPTDVRSTVERVAPAVDGLEAEIVGGDSFLRLMVEPGREVVVAGYEGEPYLRFQPDGRVEVNRRSPAAFVNESRFGSDPPASADATAPPTWDEVASGGSYAWHDHRTHWMASTRPEPPERRWAVPLTVDGEPAEIVGRYRYATPPSPWPWLALALGLAAVASAGGWRRPRHLAGAVVLAGAAPTIAYGVELGQLPGGSDGVVTVVLGLFAAVAAAASIAGRPAPGPLLAGAGSALLVAGWRHLDVLDHSVLTTSLPPTQERLVVAAALGLGLGAAIVGVAQTLGVCQPPGARLSASSGPHEPRR